jgi:hypothetical protein
MGFSIDASVELDADAAQAVRDAQEKRMMDAATKGFAVSQEEVPSDTGNLRRTAFPPEWRNNRLVWGYTAPYAKAQEFGTQPYWPPAQPLVEWANRVFGDPGIGYAVQQKIAEEGITEKRYAREGRDEQEYYLETHDFAEYLNKEL